MDVNSIVCCGFNKSYSTLPKSRSGSLGNSQLYEAALFAYQNLVFQRHVDMEYSCISESDFDTFSQKLQGCCGCCGVDNDTDTELTLAYQSCPVCFTVVGFTDDPQNDGIYADPESEIILIRDNGVYDPWFQVAGTESVSGSINGDFNWRSPVLITNPSSQYYGMIAVSITIFGDPNLPTKIQIWDPTPTPTPVFVTEFQFGITSPNNIFGPIGYDAVNDRIYFTILGLQMHYLDLATGTFTFVSNIGGTPPPGGNVNGYGLAINPITNKKYVYTSGNAVYPPDRGSIQIFSASDVLENSFPFDSIYTTPDPTIDVQFASCAGFTFDNLGYAYAISAVNANDYATPYTQRDIVKLDPVTNEVVAILNYDLTETWLPQTGNAYNMSAIQYYDGTGVISGEKILVSYRNFGAADHTNPPISPVGNTFPNSPGTISRLVAFDINPPYAATVVLEVPDSMIPLAKRFFYSYQYNKIFVTSIGSNNNVYAMTVDGDLIYQEVFPYTGGLIYDGFEIPGTNRIAFVSGEPNPNENLYIIEPVLTCPDGRINVTNEGTYEFNGSEWVPMVQTQNISNFGNQWNVSAVFNQTAVQAKLQYSTNLISWTDIEPVTGGLYHEPSEWLSGLVFVINTDEDIWFRIAIANDEDCLTYGEIFPEPPPSPNFEGSPLTLYRYNDVQFTDLSVGVPQSWAWTFESGTPATSTLENPLITYETAGIFDVTLAATNVNGTLSKTQNNYVTVNDGLLLNFIPDSEVGYSLRKINITYSGPCIRVRRDSDNVENDIFFNGVDLDISSLVAFCSGASGYVVTWYDQSGNTNDLTQLVSAEQPQIVSLGVTLSENGKPCLQFDGSDDNMNMLTSVVVTATSASIVAAHTNISGIRPLVGTSLANQISLAGALGMGIAAASAFNTFTPSTSTSQGLFTIHRNGLANPNNLSSAYRDGVQLTQGFSTPITTQTGTYTALAGAPGANRFTGKVQEVIIWNGYKESKNTVMQNDTNAYYNIY